MRAIFRTLARETVELVATGIGLTGLMRRLRPGTAIVAYHNVVAPADAGRGDRSLHMPLPKFMAQVERLARTHEIVDLDTALNEADDEPARRPKAVITFDDAYRGAVTLALPELAARGMPATVFVAPALLGVESTWWDELGEAGLLSPPTRDAAFMELHGRADRVRSIHFPDGDLPELPGSYGIATKTELLTHAGPDITLGSHAWAHEHLPSLGAEELHENLARALEWLRGLDGAFNGRMTDWLALPYGANSPETTRIAVEVGHKGVLEIVGGLRTGRRADPLTPVPRINAPAGLSPRGLELRTSGLMG